MAPFFGHKRRSSRQHEDDHPEQMTTDVKLEPSPECKLLPARKIDSADEEKIQALAECIRDYRATNPCSPDYDEYEQKWFMDPRMYLRVLRSVRGDMKHAKKRILVRCIPTSRVFYDSFSFPSPCQVLCLTILTQQYRKRYSGAETTVRT